MAVSPTAAVPRARLAMTAATTTMPANPVSTASSRVRVSRSPSRKGASSATQASGQRDRAACTDDGSGTDDTAGTDAVPDSVAAPQPGEPDAQADGKPDADTEALPGEPAAQPASASEVDPTLAAADPVATRRVDALVSLLRTALAQSGIPDLADDSTQVVLHVDHDLLAGHRDVGRSHYAHGASVCVDTARRACCDAVVQAFVHDKDGQPLAVGRNSRTPNRAQRRALGVRDGGCAFPGCTAERWLDAHHIVHWTTGGDTDLDNLVLLCRHHHRLHHEGGYIIQANEGRPRFRRPDGTPIRPPDPPPPDPRRGLPSLRDDHVVSSIGRYTARANGGGAAGWSPQYALDALLS